MHHYLEFTDEKSNKFWEITLNGKSFTVRYGKIGTGGQTQTKDFASDAEAKKEAEKLLNEKLKKGYVEKGGAKKSSSSKEKTEKKKEPDGKAEKKSITEVKAVKAEKPAATGKVSDAFAKIKDNNLKFAIIDTLMSLKLIKIESTEDIYTKVTGLPFDDDDLDLNYHYSKDVAGYYASYPVTDTMLEKVTEIFFDASCEITGIIWPHWDGECETFFISSFEGIGEALPNLSVIKGDQYGVTDLSPLAACTNLVELDIGTSEDLTPLLSLPNLKKVTLTSVENCAGIVEELKKKKIKTKIKLISNFELAISRAHDCESNNDIDAAIRWYEKAKEYGTGSFLNSLAKLQRKNGAFAEAAANYIAYIDFYKKDGGHYNHADEAFFAVECALLAGNREGAIAILGKHALAEVEGEEEETRPYISIVRHILCMIAGGPDSHDKHEKMIRGLLSENEMLKYDSRNRDFSVIEKLAAGTDLEKTIAGYIKEIRAKKGTYNSFKKQWIKYDIEPEEQKDRHEKESTKLIQNGITDLGIDPGKDWKIEVRLHEIKPPSETDASLYLYMSSNRGIWAEVSTRSGSFWMTGFIEMDIALPLHISDIPSFILGLEDKLEVSFNLPDAIIYITSSSLKGNAKKEAERKIISWLCGLCAKQNLAPEKRRVILPKILQNRALDADWYSRCGKEFPAGVDWIRVQTLDDVKTHADAWWGIVKTRYFELHDICKEAEETREDGRELRWEIADGDIFFDKSINKLAEKAAKKIKLEDNNLEYLFEGAFRELYFNDNPEQSLLVRALEVYFAGHYPCGLSADGKIMVY